MPRSLVNGNYSLLMAVESSSRANSWYRVLADRQTGHISCDCPPYIFNRNQDAEGRRFCPHTRVGEMLTTPTTVRPTHHPSNNHTLLTATQQQWPGLRGTWSIEERDAQIGSKPYHFVLLRLELGNGGTATGVVAFANTHHHTQREMVAGVAGWAGYAIAAEVARLGSYPNVGQPPEHFRIDRRQPTRRQQPAAQPTNVQSIGLADILRVGDVIQPGRDPNVVAEQTLAYFLGQETYALLERQGFLDVSSVRYANEQRVYRLRRDPNHLRERRVRVLERNDYRKDLCLVRGQNVPEADWWLSIFLMFLSDEQVALNIVQSYNVFSPYSDGHERETAPAVWQPRNDRLVSINTMSQNVRYGAYSEVTERML